jgi:DNA invertase Pin-like site-specific DNA recombinase
MTDKAISPLRQRTIEDMTRAGLSRARADGTQLGRPRLEDSDADKVAAIVTARAQGIGIRRIARELGVGVGTVLRVTCEGRLPTTTSAAFRNNLMSGTGHSC